MRKPQRTGTRPIWRSARPFPTCSMLPTHWQMPYRGNSRRNSVAEAFLMLLHKLAAASTILVLSAAAALAKQVNAEISVFQFTPIEIRASIGDAVTWTNNDAIEHSVTSDSMRLGRPLFDTGFFEAGESRNLTFEESGTWLFHCARHPSMQGKIIVK